MPGRRDDDSRSARSRARLRAAVGRLDEVPEELRRALGRRDLLAQAWQANLARLAAHPSQPLLGRAPAEVRVCDSADGRLFEVRLTGPDRELSFAVCERGRVPAAPVVRGPFAAMTAAGVALALDERVVVARVLEALKRTARALGAA
jgi:hypothetical protein